MNQEKIGKFISKKRKEKNLTQEVLAEKLSVSKNAVSKWERGICLMDMSLLKPLSEILDVSINEILNGEEIKKEELKEKTEEVLNNTIDYSNKKLKKFKHKILFIILIILFLIFISTFMIDYKRIKRNEEPLFMIPFGEKGNQYTYFGLGYKMSKKVGVSPKEPLSSSEEVRFGLWLFTWEIDVFNPNPYNIWIINGEKRLLTNIGSYCIDDTVNGEKVGICVDKIGPYQMKYEEVLDANKGDTLVIDSNLVKIKGISIYNSSGDNLDIPISHEKSSLVVPDLEGEYYISLFTYSKRGNTSYSFKINIK